MQKLLNNVDRLIIDYYRLMNRNGVDERERKRSLLSVKTKIDECPKNEIIRTASVLAKKENTSDLFKLWCDVIVLTGEVD